MTKQPSSYAKFLLAGGMATGPIFIVLGLIELIVRPGDKVNHAFSVLAANNTLDWLQMTAFIASGILFMCGALGVYKVTTAGSSHLSVPLLLGMYGLSFVLLPFMPVLATWKGTHITIAVIGLITFIVAAILLLVHYKAIGQTGSVRRTSITGIVCLAGLIGLGLGWNIAFDLAVIASLIWSFIGFGRFRKGLY